MFLTRFRDDRRHKRLQACQLHILLEDRAMLLPFVVCNKGLRRCHTEETLLGRYCVRRFPDTLDRLTQGKLELLFEIELFGHFFVHLELTER